MTGTVKIVTIYNNATGAELTALMNAEEIAKIDQLNTHADSLGFAVTVREFKAETITAEEVREILNLHGRAEQAT